MPTCPHCEADLGSGGVAGLCPECLVLGAFDSSVGGSDSRTQTLHTAAVAGDDDFGRYQILRVIGEGGMGTVYLAEQREPISRRVALKVVKLGMDTGQVLARFAKERQALAMMDHPNIARIFDAGATPKGRPYFVMEYIDGVPITQYCDNKRMTIGHDETPERIYERRWALSLIDRVVEKLREEFVQHGRPDHFERLKVFLLGHSDAPYAALAREMNTSEGALKVAIHRLRKRYRELFRQEIADTVADPAEAESELRFLAAVLTRK